MPPEPEDKMDELLKAYANQRREQAGAPFEMHPATREMLQGEVARTFHPARAKTGKPRFFNPARMFLYSTGLAAAVICVAVLVREQRPFSTALKPAAELAYAKPGNEASQPAALSLPTDTPSNLLTLNSAGTEEAAKQRDLLMAGQPGQKPESTERKFAGREVVKTDSGANIRKTGSIQNKLDHIIIPKIEFRDATVREAVDFLQQKSRDLDSTETDPALKGITIVLKTDLPSGLADAPAKAMAPAPAVPGLPAQGDLGSTVVPTDARITLSLTNIPLSEALRYITNLAGLKLKIDDRAVTMVPLSEGTKTLVTKEYIVPPGLLANSSDLSLAGELRNRNLEKAIDASADAKDKSPVSLHNTAQELLSNDGIPFPPGAYARYDPHSNKLVVRNTDDNLDLVDQDLGVLNSAASGQLKTRSLETGSTALQNNAPVLARAEAAKKDTDLTAGAAPLTPAAAAAAPAAPMPTMDTAAPQADMAVAGAAAPGGAPEGGSGQALERRKAAKPASGSSNILALFQIQLKGDQIRLVDTDGSIYAGKIDLPRTLQQLAVVSNGQMFSNAATFNKQASRQLQQGAHIAVSGVTAGISNSVAQAQQQDQAQSQSVNLQQRGYPFRVSGNSESLQRFVVIEGTCVIGFSQQAGQDEKQAAAKQLQEDAITVKAGAPVVRIQGEARIGDDRNIAIDAAPLPLKVMKTKE